MQIEQKALKRAFWSSLSKLLGILMAAGAGSIISQTIGQQSSWALHIAVFMALVGFVLIFLAEYLKEKIK